MKESRALKKRIEKTKIDIENFENELQSFIELKLKDQYESLWWEDGVPEYIRNTIENKIELMKSEKEYEVANRIRFLDLTHCNLIITNDKNWDKIFIHVFQNKSELESNIESLRMFKNNLHDKTVNIKELISYPVYINTIRNYFSCRFNIFLSYSTLDTEYFQIKDLVEKLESFPEIDKVFFWEVDSGENIVSYMERTLRLSKVFLLFCSNNALKFKAVEDEWQATFQLRKKSLMKIVPVYEKEENIPYSLMPMLNVKFTKENKEEFIEKLYREIIR